uniref:RNase H type-1 domain-containing protein n=1 Tax=Fagus sylvatica TaxID=28930 RepID=A0A2N9EKL1_FAGSY
MEGACFLHHQIFNKAIEFYFSLPRTMVNSPKQPILIGWEPPTPGFIKLNTDGSVSENPGLASVGSLLRDHNGGSYSSILRRFTFNISTSKRTSVQDILAKAGGTSLTVFFLYSLLPYFSSVKLENTIEDFWVEDIWFLCQQHRRYLFSTVSTDTNKAAVALAKMGIGRYQHQVWIEEAPVELSGLL